MFKKIIRFILIRIFRVVFANRTLKLMDTHLYFITERDVEGIIDYSYHVEGNYLGFNRNWFISVENMVGVHFYIKTRTQGKVRCTIKSKHPKWYCLVKVD